MYIFPDKIQAIIRMQILCQCGVFTTSPRHTKASQQDITPTLTTAQKFLAYFCFYPLLPYRFFCHTAYFLEDCKLMFKLQKGGRGRAQGENQESFGKLYASLWVFNWEKFSSLRINSNTKPLLLRCLFGRQLVRQISLKLIAQSPLKYCVSSWVLEVIQKPSSQGINTLSRFICNRV